MFHGTARKVQIRKAEDFCKFGSVSQYKFIYFI